MPVEAEIAYRYILAGFGFLALAATLIGLSYISYKREKDIPKRERPIDPLMKAIFVTIFVLALLAFVNIFEKDFFIRYWWIGTIVFIAVFSFYIVMLRKRLPLNIYQQYDKCIEVLEYFFNATTFKGQINYPPLWACRTTSEVGRDNVGNWFMPMKAGGKKIDFLVQIDKVSREVLTIDYEPSTIEKEKMHGKRFPQKPKTIAEYFGEESEEEKTAETEGERQEA